MTEIIEMPKVNVNEMYKDKVPNVTFKTREADEYGAYYWVDKRDSLAAQKHETW